MYVTAKNKTCSSRSKARLITTFHILSINRLWGGQRVQANFIQVTIQFTVTITGIITACRVFPEIKYYP